jgi:endonuclease YncB( thermonuclease family)
MQGFRRTVLVAALALAMLAAAAGQASAQSEVTGPCPQAASGTTCDLWSGRVKFVGDGDTISVDVAGDGTKTPVRVRITGIQAMEETYYTNRPQDRRGACHANEAADRLQQLIREAHYNVQLAAQNPESSSRKRPRREVAVKLHHKWRDLGRIMIEEGQALWLPNSSEWAWNRAYSTLAEQAAAKQVGLWDPEFCGPGPDAHLSMWAYSNPETSHDVDGEWIRIRNLDPVNPLPLGGWWVRDSGLRSYTLPPDATIAPGSEITVWIKQGTNTPTDFFWGLTSSVFDNIRVAKSTGDGAYLFDPQGDLRAAMQYPCRYQCSDPNKGALSINPHYRGTEYVDLTNTTQAPIDLEGYQLLNTPHSYAFGPGSVVGPGATMRVYVKGDPATDGPLVKHWGLHSLILSNSSDKVELASMRYVRIGCYSWGSASC